MNTKELSDEFDVLYNNITSAQAPGLNEYEKSVFLTKAQYDILKNYFDPIGNKFQEGFDGSKKRQADFTNLIKTKVLQELTIDDDLKFDRRSRCYSMPNDLFIPINEKCSNRTHNYVVSPISYQEYDALMLKPYQYPVKRQVWRLFTDRQVSKNPVVTTTTVNNSECKFIFSNTSNKKVTFILKAVEQSSEKAPVITVNQFDVTIECNIAANSPTSEYWSNYLIPHRKDLVSYLGDLTGSEVSSFPNFIVPADYSITIEMEPTVSIIELIGKMPEDTKYIMRYLIKPKPIILVDLDDGLFEERPSIDGLSTKTECELDPQIHPEILQRAVELAKAAYIGDLNTQIALGQTSQTNIGVVQSSK